jgi:hypothetical protein
MVARNQATWAARNSQINRHSTFPHQHATLSSYPPTITELQLIRRARDTHGHIAVYHHQSLPSSRPTPHFTLSRASRTRDSRTSRNLVVVDPTLSIQGILQDGSDLVGASRGEGKMNLLSDSCVACLAIAGPAIRAACAFCTWK